MVYQGYQTHSPRRTLVAMMLALNIPKPCFAQVFHWPLNRVHSMIAVYKSVYEVSQLQNKFFFPSVSLLRSLQILKLLKVSFYENTKSSTVDQDLNMLTGLVKQDQLVIEDATASLMPVTNACTPCELAETLAIERAMNGR